MTRSWVRIPLVITIHYVLLSVSLNFRTPRSRATPPFTLTVISTPLLKELKKHMAACKTTYKRPQAGSVGQNSLEKVGSNPMLALVKTH